MPLCNVFVEFTRKNDHDHNMPMPPLGKVIFGCLLTQGSWKLARSKLGGLRDQIESGFGVG